MEPPKTPRLPHAWRAVSSRTFQSSGLDLPCHPPPLLHPVSFHRHEFSCTDPSLLAAWLAMRLPGSIWNACHILHSTPSVLAKRQFSYMARDRALLEQNANIQPTSKDRRAQTIWQPGAPIVFASPSEPELHPKSPAVEDDITTIENAGVDVVKGILPAIEQEANPRTQIDHQDSASLPNTLSSKPDAARPLSIFDTSLEYQIPLDVLQAAANKPSSETTWSHLLYRSRTSNRPVTVYLCTKKIQAEGVARKFLNEPILGFDLEWESRAKLGVSGAKKLVSLIQLAKHDAVALFQISLFYETEVNDLLPPTLRAILESRDVIKAGVNIAGDATRLSKVLNLQSRSLFEVSNLYKVVRYAEARPELVNRSAVALATQVEHVYGMTLSKETTIRKGAWSRLLNKTQSDYAAADAYAGYRLYCDLEAQRLALKTMPARPEVFDSRPPAGTSGLELEADIVLGAV